MASNRFASAGSTRSGCMSFLEKSVQTTLQTASRIFVNQLGCRSFVKLFGRQTKLGSRVIKFTTFNSGSHFANL
jgi:hypothetical protein